MPNAPFPIDPVLVAITIAYRNAGYIADGVFPRVLVGKQEFKYFAYPKEETFARPDTKVGRRSRPNEIDLTASELTDSTQDYGLDDPVPQADIDNAPANYDPVGRAVMTLTDYIMIDREARAAGLLFDAAQYAAANKITLAGTDQFSDFDASDPIDVITAGKDAALMPVNVMAMGQEVYTKLSQHPKIVKAVHGNSGDAGIATRQAIANLFEVEEVLVGQSRLNTAKKGQAAVLSRIWGKDLAMFHRDRNADTRNGITFGYTAQWGGRVAGQERDSNIGLRGGQRVRVGESVVEKIVAPDAGYLIKDAVA